MKARYDNLDEYIADLKAEIAGSPDCANHHYNLGIAYLSKRDFIEAEKSFLEAMTNRRTLWKRMCSSAALRCSAATLTVA
jgi:tetratricopeptide (TPR) repeat protein